MTHLDQVKNKKDNSKSFLFVLCKLFLEIVNQCQVLAVCTKFYGEHGERKFFQKKQRPLMFFAALTFILHLS